MARCAEIGSRTGCAGDGMAGAAVCWSRRARPLLGTLVEVGIDAATPEIEAAFTTAFAAIVEVQQALSRFDPASDVARFNALPAGAALSVRPSTLAVLGAAQELHAASDGLFDVSLGSGPAAWRCAGGMLEKRDAAVRLDLGGIGKGYAVDAAVEALEARGVAAGWVNAGGDLRAFGAAEVPIWLRDETAGGVRVFATLAGGAFATSRYGAGSRSTAVAPPRQSAASPRRENIVAPRRRNAVSFRPESAAAHVSVAAPQCLWADALTKIVALSGDAQHGLLSRHAATAWRHA